MTNKICTGMLDSYTEFGEGSGGCKDSVCEHGSDKQCTDAIDSVKKVCVTKDDKICVKQVERWNLFIRAKENEVCHLDALGAVIPKEARNSLSLNLEDFVPALTLTCPTVRTQPFSGRAAASFSGCLSVCSIALSLLSLSLSFFLSVCLWCVFVCRGHLVMLTR
jgi:hypothetical protein